MSIQKGRDLLLQVGDGAEEENFTDIGAARATAVAVNNHPIDATTLDDDVQVLRGEAGVQSMEISFDGHFRDGAAEEVLRAAAFSGTARTCRLVFPNGDAYQAAFVVTAYRRAGDVEGLETFSATLARSGAGSFTAGG